jgi:hypothetical protein
MEAGVAPYPDSRSTSVCRFFAATFETGLPTGYTIAQYCGCQWGKRVYPQEAARFHTVVLVSITLGATLLLTTIDPVQLTDYSLIFSAVVLPPISPPGPMQPAGCISRASW